jgi:ABC-type transport system involved in multi-copper enzyme maturation permease subunit
MIAILKNLAWKEFHELKSAAFAATAITLSIPMCYIFRDINAAYLGVHTAFAGYPLLAGVFFGMRAAAGERASRTATFVAALPASYRLLGVARLMATLAAACVPVVALLFLGAILRSRVDQHMENTGAPLVTIFGWSILATAVCVTVSAVAGLGQPTEVRAGAIGFAGVLASAFVGWFLLNLGVEWLPFFSGLAIDESFQRLAVCVIPLPVVAGLIIFPLNYYRALGQSAERTGKPWTIGAWRPTPIPAPIAALVWKGFREIGFLGLQVLVISLVLSLFAGALGLTNNPQSNLDPVLKALPQILWVAGFVLAVLVGVGAVIGDLQAGVNTFWRSRPIPPQLWYWTKYLIGLATIFIAIEIPSLMCIGAMILDVKELHSPLLWLLVWNVTFSFALTATSLVRQPAHAGILAIGGVGILYSIVQAPFDGFTPGEPGAPLAILATVFLIAFIASTLLGSWAAEHDVAIS